MKTRKKQILNQASLITEEELNKLMMAAQDSILKKRKVENMRRCQEEYKLAISAGDQNAATEARRKFNSYLKTIDLGIDIEKEYTAEELESVIKESEGDFGINVGQAMNLIEKSNTKICINILSSGGVKTMMKQIVVDPFNITLSDLRVYCDALMNAKRERIRASNAISAVLNRQDSEIKSADLYNVLCISLHTKEWVEAGYEKLVKSAAQYFPVCNYLIQIDGVAEASASNLYARVQLAEGAYSVSSIWSYCGMNDNLTPYLGRQAAREVINQAKKVVSEDYHKTFDHILRGKMCFVKLGKAHENVKFGSEFDKYSGMTESEREEIKAIFAKLSPTKINQLIDACVCLYDKKHPSNKEISQIGMYSGRHQNKVKSFKTDAGDLTYESIIKGLSKPPYNTKAKTITYQIIDNIIRKGTSKYATLYRKRKAYEVANNEAGYYVNEARNQLRKKNYESETAKTCLTQGKLTPAHIDRRARRYVAKIFLSHYFELLWIEKYGKLPKLAPVFSDGNHYHYIMPEYEYDIMFDVENINDVRVNSNGTPIVGITMSDYEFEAYTGKFTKNLSVYGDFVDDDEANAKAISAIYDRVAEEKEEIEEE